MIGILNDVKNEPILISETKDDIEILVVEVKIGKLPLRLITAYCPQEDENKDKINMFYRKLEEEIVSCETNGCGMVLELDCNAKLGSSIIKGDAHLMSKNGKLLWEIKQRRDLPV